jgi:hypothetical protein
MDMNTPSSCLFSFGPPDRKRGLEIYPMHFTTGTPHESTTVPMILLDYEGSYEYSFGTYIEVMGCYLLVLIAHGSLFRRYQTLYLIDWVQGRIICVSSSPHVFPPRWLPFLRVYYVSFSADAW